MANFRNIRSRRALRLAKNLRDCTHVLIFYCSAHRWTHTNPRSMYRLRSFQCLHVHNARIRHVRSHTPLSRCFPQRISAPELPSLGPSFIFIFQSSFRLLIESGYSSSGLFHLKSSAVSSSECSCSWSFLYRATAPAVVGGYALARPRGSRTMRCTEPPFAPVDLPWAFSFIRQSVAVGELGRSASSSEIYR